MSFEKIVGALVEAPVSDVEAGFQVVLVDQKDRHRQKKVGEEGDDHRRPFTDRFFTGEILDRQVQQYFTADKS